MRLMASRSGIALVVTVLVTAVVVVTVLATATVVTLGVRRGTSDEARSYRALLLAESAMNVARTTVAAQRFEADEFDVANNVDARVAFNAFLAQAASIAVAGGDGTVTPSSFPIAGGNGVAVEMAANVGGANARVLLDFMVDQLQDVLSLNAPAALTSIPRIIVSGDATVSGVDASEENWVRTLGPTPSAWAFGGVGDAGESIVTTSSSIAGAVQSGDYVTTEVSGAREVFRVLQAPPADGLGANQLELRRVTDGASGALSVPANSVIQHRPFAVTATVTAPATTGGEVRLPVTYPGFYRDGDTLTLMGTINGLEHTATFTVAQIDGNEIITTGIPANFRVTDGTTLRRTVLGAISNGKVETNGEGAAVNGGFVEGASLVRENLFEQTFGQSIGFVEGLARTAGTYYDNWSQVPSSGTNRQVSGITFVGNGVEQNISFCGTGILIVVGNLQTNNAGCPFTGLIYVTGDWDEKGNRDLTGAVVVEGLITCSGEACDTTVAGTGAGNEDKLRYDPFALYSIALDQFPANTIVEVVDGTWRQQ